MSEFGGGGEATSNYESMPVPSIAGMTHYHYDLDHNLIAESISSGKVQKEYIYLPANLAVIADNIDLPSEALAKGGMSAASALPVAHLNNTNNGNSTNETLYIINDHERTPTKLTSSTKAVVWDRFQTPFGENASLTGTKETNIRLPGQYFDFESNYHYNLMRDYDAKTGRYLQSDPIGLSGGMNRYGYAMANPVKYVDPKGLKVFLCKRPADIYWPVNLADHHWIKTDHYEAGMGGPDGGVPGQGRSDWPYTRTTTNDHSGQSLAPNATCEEQYNVSESCVDDKIKPGQPTGRWAPLNQCQSFARNAINSCRILPDLH